MLYIDVGEAPATQTKKPIITNTISNEDYHAMPGVSSTALVFMEKSYKAFDNRHLFPYDSPALVKGDLWHTAILEPHALGTRYMESPTVGLETKAAQAAREENPGVTIVEKGGLAEAESMGNKVRVIYGDILAGCQMETSIIVQDETYGIKRKCRPDAWDRAQGIVIDVKTTAEVSPQAFKRKVEQLKYHRQAAWYMDTMELAGVKPKIMALLVVPTNGTAPFGFYFSDEMLQKGRDEYHELLKGYKEYREDGYDKLFKEIFSWEFIQQQKGL